MFRSKKRNLIFPQTEHSRLAGMIASLWGNDLFDRPAFHFESFVTGVILHDHGHGYFDTHEIGAMTSDERLASMELLVEHCLDDPLLDTVAKFHILRLLQLQPGPGWQSLILDCEQQISTGIDKTGISHKQFEWANQITWVCDTLSFDFCFEVATHSSLILAPQQDSRDTMYLEYKIDGSGCITLDPWPLSQDGFENFILGYEADQYPRVLKPVVVPFILRRK
jgi:hypothetical protein